MLINLQRDAKVLLAALSKKVKAYAASAAKSSKVPPLSAIAVGYEFEQSGWMVIHFDTRPTHSRDGEWTRFSNKDLIKCPSWAKAAEAMFVDDEDGSPSKKAVTLVLPDGKKKDGRKFSESQYATILGSMIKGVLLQSKKDGIFASLPKQKICQIDIEEFNGSWAWPAYEKLGKTNLV